MMEVCRSTAPALDRLYLIVSCLLPVDLHAHGSFQHHPEDLMTAAEQHHFTLASGSSASLWTPHMPTYAVNSLVHTTI
eukprot:6310655-Amphidinium_carterae.1